MNRTQGRRLGAALTVSAALLTAVAANAHASIAVDLRVTTNDPAELANLRQYVPSTTAVKTFAGDDCFDPTPPIKQSSGKTYTQPTPTMLGAVDEAATARDELRPLRVSDADYSTFNALSICSIDGARTPPGFFFLKTNHVGNSLGADLTFLNGGEQLLFYRSPPDFSADEELDLTAPAQATPGVPITVQVRSYAGDGTVAPTAGATVAGGDVPAKTDAAGNATVVFATPGERTLFATKDYNDIPSQALKVCVEVDLAKDCRATRGLDIVGSYEPDRIDGTAGDDLVSLRGGNDKVKAGAGNDYIISRGGGRDTVRCGRGTDRVKADRKDRIAKSCEKVKRKNKKRDGGGKDKKGS